MKTKLKIIVILFTVSLTLHADFPRPYSIEFESKIEKIDITDNINN